MKAPIGKDVYKILKDSKGNEELQKFIGSNKNTTVIELSTGEIYKIMPLRDYKKEDK